MQVLNFDETPIPFEYLDGRTYSVKGSHTVAGKSDRGGWSKRQATLILYIFADGLHRIPPKIIFHGNPSAEGGQIEARESDLYAAGVTVEFNDTAYNNEELMIKFIDEELLSLTDTSTDKPLMLVMDCAAFHKTPTILRKLKDKNIHVVMIPPGCTGLLQPLDTHCNMPFKVLLRHYTELYADEREERLGEGENQCVEKWSTSDKRVMVTHVVARAWEAFCRDKKTLVVKSFRDTGIYMAADKSEDHDIRIKGYQPGEIVLGDVTQRDPEIEAYEYRPIDLSFDADDEFILDEEVRVTNDFTGLTVCQLKEACKQRKIKGFSKLKKAELLEKLREWEALKQAEVQRALAVAAAVHMAQLAQSEE
jgi:DDE superfamily endonuclease